MTVALPTLRFTGRANEAEKAQSNTGKEQSDGGGTGRVRIERQSQSNRHNSKTYKV